MVSLAPGRSKELGYPTKRATTRSTVEKRVGGRRPGRLKKSPLASQLRCSGRGFLDPHAFGGFVRGTACGGIAGLAGHAAVAFFF